MHRFYLVAEAIWQDICQQRCGCTALFPFAICSPFPVMWAPKLSWMVKQKIQEEWDVRDTAGGSSQPGVTSQESCGSRNSSDPSADPCTKIISWTLQTRDSFRFQLSGLHWILGPYMHLIASNQPIQFKSKLFPQPTASRILLADEERSFLLFTEEAVHRKAHYRKGLLLTEENNSS